MSNVDAVNKLKNHRLELIRQLEMLMNTRSQRGTYISRETTIRISKLEKEIHTLTHQLREEIKKCYSGSRTSST
jgi:hypothetical protein